MSVPVKLAPFALKRQVLEQVLSWQFRQALADGELEFLEGRWLSIHVRDIGLLWYTSVSDGRLVVSHGRSGRQLQRRRQRSADDRRA
jgi:predicted lipid carrier protein YhbT